MEKPRFFIQTCFLFAKPWFEDVPGTQNQFFAGDCVLHSVLYVVAILFLSPLDC